MQANKNKDLAHLTEVILLDIVEKQVLVGQTLIIDGRP